MKRACLVVVALVLSVAGASAQQWDRYNGGLRLSAASSSANPLVVIDQRGSGKILSLRAAGVEKCSISTTGALTCAGAFTPTGQILAADGTAAAPAYSFASQPNAGLYKSGTNRVGGSAAGTALWEWGNGGINLASTTLFGWSGTTDPSGTLDVTLSRLANNQIQQVGSGQSLYRLASSAADGTGVLGQFSFYSTTNTGGANEPRIVILEATRAGATATQRGGDFNLYTKPNASATLNQWTFSSTGTFTLAAAGNITAPSTMNISSGGGNGLTITNATGAVTGASTAQFTALGVGVTPPTAGIIQANSHIYSGGDIRTSAGGFVYWLGRAGIVSGAAGTINFEDSATGLIGIGFDFATDGTLKIRNRAQNADIDIHVDNVEIGNNRAIITDSRGGIVLGASADGQGHWKNNNASSVLYERFGAKPTCTSNCGTSPTVTGVDSSFTVTMGATGSPASGWVITFGQTWPAAPECSVWMAKAGMAVGKLPLTPVTTTTTLTVTTNGTAPANGDIYSAHCRLGA